MTTPSISIAMCTYNGARFLEQQLASLFDQTVPPNEIVICDDGSTDGTIEILQSYCTKYKSIVTLVQNPERLGFGENFRKAIQLCTGNIIFLSDQDDVWHEDKIEQMCSFLECYPEAWGVFSNAQLVDEQNLKLPLSLWQVTYGSDLLAEELNPSDYFPLLAMYQNFIAGTTLAFRSHCCSFIFNTWLQAMPWHDFLIVLKLSLRKKLMPIPKCLSNYRQHSQQTAGLNGYMTKKEEVEFRRSAWNENWHDLNALQVCRHFAFGIHDLKRLEKDLIKTTEEKVLFDGAIMLLEAKLDKAKRVYFATFPFAARKWKLIKHYLKGGEYLKVSLGELIKY